MCLGTREFCAMHGSVPLNFKPCPLIIIPKMLNKTVGGRLHPSNSPDNHAQRLCHSIGAQIISVSRVLANVCPGL